MSEDLRSFFEAKKGPRTKSLGSAGFYLTSLRMNFLPVCFGWFQKIV